VTRCLCSLALAAFCFLALLPLAYLPDVFQVSEAREGVVTQEILRSGNRVLPLRHGTIVPSKPPLFHWLGSLNPSLKQFSLELFLRLPSLISATTLVFIVSLFCSGLAGLKAGLISVALLMTSWSFLRLATDGRVDMLFIALLK